MRQDKKTAQQKYEFAGYKSYFRLNINQRINERQHRNALNINYLFSTVISSCTYSGFENYLHPKVNNGLFHHYGKNHSKYASTISDNIK
jgi:hypothetical protein